MAVVAFLGSEYVECSDCAPVFYFVSIYPWQSYLQLLSGHCLKDDLSPARSHMRKWMNADFTI